MTVAVSSAIEHTDKDGNPQPLTPAEIGAVCHAANLEYRILMEEDGGPNWEDAPASHRASLINGVMFALANPDATPEQQHAAWYQEKASQGWKYGPEKNTDKREHPCFVPYHQLPVSQRRKDALFRAIVLALKG
jgi:hypothetical protein